MIDLEMLNTLDFFTLGIIIISTLFAIWRGFISSFISLVGWVSSIYLAYYLFPEVKPILEAKIKNQFIILIAGHTLLMLGFLILFGIINTFLNTAMSSMTKGMFDRALGAAFGVIRGGVIVSFFFLVFSTAVVVFYGAPNNTSVKEDDAMPDWIKNAQTYSYLKFGKSAISEFIPDTFYSRIEETYESVSNKSTEQRFIESVTKKLDDKLPSEIKDELDQMGQIDSNSMSQEEYDTKHAKDVLNAYKKLQNSESDKSPDINDAELQELEKAVNR